MDRQSGLDDRKDAPPGEGEEELLVIAAINHLRAGDKVVFITTERSLEEVKDSLVAQ